MNRKTFLKGAAILGVAGIIVQIMGAIFRIPLANIIGAEGMGYYQTAYPIYIVLLVFSTNGAPAAISKMTSERIALGQNSEAHRVFKVSFLLMAVFGLITSSIFFFGAGKIVELLGNVGAYYSMIAIAPALLFVPIMAVFRGYYQGLQDMTPTATSQIVEQFVRVAIGLSLAVFLVPVGIEYAAAGASVGASVGPVAGIIFLLIIYMKRRKTQTEYLINTSEEIEKSSELIKKLASIAIPITIGVSILPIMNIIDLGIVMRRLQSVGFTPDQANALYGQLTGMAGPIINIPQALALSIALSLVPAIAASKSAGDTVFLKQNVKLSFRTAIMIGIPCTLGLMILAEPIMLLIYPMQAESAVSAAPSLFLLGIGVIFLAVGQTMVGILQGLGKPGIAVYTLLAGMVVKTVVTYLLVGVPSLNVQGAAIGSSAAYVVIGILNFLIVKKETNTQFDIKLSVIRPLIAGLIMSVVVLIFYYGIAPIVGIKLATVIAICFGAAAYVMVLIKIKAIEANEIKALPKGDKLYKLLKKCRLL